MSIRFRTGALCAALILLVSACDANQVRPDTTTLALAPRVQAVTASMNTSGLPLLREVVTANPGQNVALSPLSLQLALGMAWAGADGDTREELAGAVGLAPEGALDGEAFAALLDYLPKADPLTLLQSSQSVWADDGFTLHPDYETQLTTDFQASGYALDLQGPQAVPTINDWIALHTNGMLKDVLQSIDASARLMLVNTLLFEGVWTHQFDADQTRNRPFYRADGTTVEHPMMTQSVTIPFTYHRDAYVAELPYGSGAAYTMLVAVPTTDLDGWIEQLTPEDLATLQAGFREQEVDVLLPRFTLETKQYLKAPLVALGVEQAFQPGVANFARMSANGEELFIGDVLQNVRLAVDERGTKAAAATVIDMRTTSLGPMLHADRPFLVLIREKQSGVILFAAAVYDPS